MDMFLEDEIRQVKETAIAEGYSRDTVEIWETQSRAKLRLLGFADAAEVRRIADRYGRRR